MTYTMGTRALRDGLVFKTHELAPLGIREGSSCWGLWVEGRDFDKHSRLDKDNRCHGNESPHMVVSPIDTKRWPSAFNLKALLHRRPISADEPDPLRCDSFLGLCDALHRCRVNVLYIQTAQIGYDLISVDATCELPHLRMDVETILAPADQASEDLDDLRASLCPDRVVDERAHPTLSQRSKEVADIRTRAFQMLGLMLVPELAELEARLLSMERSRYRASRLEEKARNKGSQSAASELAARLGRWDNPAEYERLVGDVAVAGARIEEEFLAALRAPWFFNRKVVAAGENTYFLTYESISNRQLATEYFRELGVRRAMANPDHGDLKDLICIPPYVDALHHSLRMLLTQRKFDNESGLASLIRPSSPKGGGHPSTRPAVAERLLHQGVPGAKENEPNDPRSTDAVAAADSARHAEEWYRDFFRRQAFQPIQITALSSLAYARCWAFSGAVGRGAPVQFEYRDGLLSPKHATEPDAGCLAPIYAFLNTTTRAVLDDPKRGVFGPESAVMVNFDLQNRAARLRFVRERVQPTTYLTVCLKYELRAEAPEGPNSKGLLKFLFEVLLDKRFRIERATNTIVISDAVDEKGTVEVIARATNDDAAEQCERISSQVLRERFEGELCALFRNRYEKANGPPSPTQSPDTASKGGDPKPVFTISIQRGFVPRGR